MDSKYIYYDRDDCEHKVNWVSLLSEDEAYRLQASERAIAQSPLEETIPVLIKGGFLSYKKRGNFWLTDGRGNNLSPRDGALQPLFFTRKRDAEAFRLMRYGEAQYPVEIAEL